MLRREGWPVNKKRIRRLYRLEGLQLRMRIRRRKHMCLHRGPVPQPTAPGERWSMDFVHDQLLNGRPFRMLTVVDQMSRESPLIEVAFSMSGHKVADPLDRRLADGPVPTSLTVDHGTEFTSKALEKWAWQRGIKLDFTRPGKPMDNGHIESFNGRLRLREPAGAEAQRVQVLVVRAAAGDRLYAVQTPEGRRTPCRFRRLGGFGGIR